MGVAEVSAALERSRPRVYQLISEGVIPSVRIGRSIRVPRAAFDAWLAVLEDQAVSNLGREPGENGSASMSFSSSGPSRE